MKEYYLIFNNNSILDALSVIATRNPHWTESPLDGIPTGRNPHWTESPPEFHVSVGIQDSGDSGHLGTESPPYFCSC